MRACPAVLAALLLSSPARAQDEDAPPVPPAPPEASSGEAPEPGFEAAPEARARPSARPPEVEDEPVSVPSKGRNERLIGLINQTRGEVTLGELIDEILADVVAELDRRAPKQISPMAIREISLGANVEPAFAKKLRSTIVAQIHGGTRIRMVRCIECEATRTRIEGEKWIITRGVVNSAELRAVGARLGARSFLDVAFGFEPESGLVEMDFQVIRASDAQVLWSENFRADETTPMLMRSSEAPVRREDRLRDLEMLLEGRPFYGYAASAGFMLLPYNDPASGDITGATAGYRIYERFGEERRVMFGLDLMGFLNTERLAGGLISAGSWWIPIRPDLVNPELRLGAKAGAFIAGSEGNAAVFQLGSEVLLRYRFGLYLYALFMTKSAFLGNELGGVGMSTGLSFNW